MNTIMAWSFKKMIEFKNLPGELIDMASIDKALITEETIDLLNSPTSFKEIFLYLERNAFSMNYVDCAIDGLTMVYTIGYLKVEYNIKDRKFTAFDGNGLVAEFQA